jgi:2-polyprenyl-3-methyl-5-hydroxy-6-metoxy-1,4-benzoquinol methylase
LFLTYGKRSQALSGADELRRRTPHLIAAIRRFLPADGDASIIDLGSGFGAFIHTARTLGYRNIEGCELALERVNTAAAFGINSIVHGDLFDVLRKQEDGSRDVVVSFDVLEHLNKPQVVHCAQQVYRVLRPGGRWLIHTVNGESPWFGRIRYGDFTHELAFTHHSLHEVLTAASFSRIDFHEDAPAVHGASSVVRWVLWRMLCTGLRFRMAIETGSFDRAAIFTQNLFAVAFK